MIDFLTIALIVFGVLQIILFFKMWGMTNDVKLLTNKFCKNSRLEETLHNIIADETSDGDIEISIGDAGIRRKDSKEMIVDRIICGKYGCADPNTHTFIAGYSRNEIRKKEMLASSGINQ